VTLEVLRIKGVHKRFGVHEVLQGVTLTVSRGEVIAIIGPSGSGKSTLLRCINGLEQVDAGEIWMAEDRVTGAARDLPRIRRKIGMVFQHFNLFPHMNVIKNVAVGPMVVLRKPRAEAYELAKRLLDRVGLGGKEEAAPYHLSGGQQQRVAIARALAMEPSLILFDEPTSALDPELVNEVLLVMRDLAKQGMTMIVVTHEISFAEQAASRLVMFDRGIIVEEGSPREVLERPRRERTRIFLKQLEHVIEP
jgi:ABC-type polar amino acid transport system ATPase subunit